MLPTNIIGAGRTARRAENFNKNWQRGGVRKFGSFWKEGLVGGVLERGGLTPLETMWIWCIDMQSQPEYAKTIFEWLTNNGESISGGRIIVKWHVIDIVVSLKIQREILLSIK